jgi:hypothetical protein
VPRSVEVVANDRGLAYKEPPTPGRLTWRAGRMSAGHPDAHPTSFARKMELRSTFYGKRPAQSAAPGTAQGHTVGRLFDEGTLGRGGLAREQALGVGYERAPGVRLGAGEPRFS